MPAQAGYDSYHPQISELPVNNNYKGINMSFRLIGGILLVVGTSIGAGMLALPIATAKIGFFGSCLLMVVCWFIMLCSALILLEINLWLPKNSNLISMAKATIGPAGQLIAWLTYLLLLYSLLCAYIAGGSDLLHHLFLNKVFKSPNWLSVCLFTLFFGVVVYGGIHWVDYTNRGLMSVKFTAYFLLVLLLIPFIKGGQLIISHFNRLFSGTALTVTITSFGYATIVPSLRVYFESDERKLKATIIIGSLIPLVCYILWDAVIMGVIPLKGDYALTKLLQTDNPTSNLVNAMTTTASNTAVTFFAQLFTSICMLTSFLGVALCLADFWADGLQLEKKGWGNFVIHMIALLPPLIIVLFIPSAFVKALEYAGIYTVILLILLPAWMAWRGRYSKAIANGYQVAGGKFLLVSLVIFAFAMIIWWIVDMFTRL